MKEAKQFNNITTRVIDDLKESLNGRSQLSIATASFSIYAYEALKEGLEQIDELRFIFTSPTFHSAQEKAAGKRGQSSSLELPSGSRLGEARALKKQLAELRKQIQ